MGQEEGLSGGEAGERKKEGLRLGNAHHLVLMALPNILVPSKLASNVRHPVYEVLHTAHRQYLIGEGSTYVVEHALFGRLVTVDVIEEDALPSGFISRVRQLLRRDFYYGHASYFPKPFRLVERTYVEEDDFDLGGYIESHSSGC